MTDIERELHDAKEQLAASSEILAALGRHASDPSAVWDTVLEYAARLCGAAASQLFIRDGDVFRLSRVSDETPEDYRRYLMTHPIARNRSSTVGRAAEDKCTVQIADVLADADYGRLDLQRLAGFRTLLSTPMVLQDEVVGVLAMWRTDVAPFDDRERRLLEEFAVQGAVVLRQVDLMRALESRGVELADKVEQLEALREIDEAVGSSLDLDEVLERVVTNAVRLINLGFGDITLNTEGGSILEYDEKTDSFHVRGRYGSSPTLWERLRHIVMDSRSSFIGRSALADQPLEIPDLAAVDRDEFLDTVFGDGWRSVLAVPMIVGEQMIGVLVVRRRGTGDFPPDVTELLETFAGQSALAIVNARLYRELETQSRELEIASNHKSEFLASMSHELRTPLNAVIGFSEVLLERMFGDINERQEEYLRDIWNSGRHLLQLLNEILDLSKVEAGRMTLDPTVFSVAGALEYTLAMVRERAAANAITMSVDIADEVGDIEADELRFKQVVLNLVSNAVKFTPDGGKVCVHAHRNDAELIVTVTDTGIGVPPEDQEKIFDSFQQGGRGPAREEGTGLGLTLCRRIVGLFGGRMWLESAVGVGSTFGFAIPAASRSTGSAMMPQDGEFPVVVLVDDDRASLDLMSAYLDDVPVQVVRVTDGVSALDLIRKVVPAAVVLDIKLPRLDGWQVLAELKTDGDTAAVPVIVASVVDDRPRGLALGAAVQLLKPLSRDDFVDALRTVGVLKDGRGG
ncbi:ATP-binding protein [Mycobacterium sp. ITM-2016-00318]|uniref:ATP-binding protein n=1 Tax=Mycobacterium sp. ITM-2016-00318 TaxID=2099693 RepID=UPI000CFA1A6C|nr:ATP-binding protein [Mycobacterium sp. ITM-2016-00318]WNG93727.1 GAF domain-containing protein [Mycobacterium sp. ITM-2016-00318]